MTDILKNNNNTTSPLRNSTNSSKTDEQYEASLPLATTIDNTPSSLSPTAPTTLDAVAARIQERATLLQREQEQVQDFQEKLTRAQTLLSTEQEKTNSVHYEYLQQLQLHTELELEYMQLQEKLTTCQNEIEETKQETVQLQRELDTEQDDWKKNVVEAIMVPHRIKRTLYETALQDAIDSVVKTKQQRQACLEQLQRECDNFQSETEWIQHSQLQQIDAETKRLQDMTAVENEKVANLANQVRQAVEKVCCLFACLCVCICATCCGYFACSFLVSQHPLSICTPLSAHNCKKRFERNR